MKIDRAFRIRLIFIILTISQGEFSLNHLNSNAILYVGIFWLLFEIVLSFFRQNIKIVCNRFLFYVLCVTLSSIGIFVQNLVYTRKITLALSMFILFAYAILSNRLINSYKQLRAIAEGILCGVLINLSMAIVGGESLFSNAYEMVISFGFNGGMIQKNYFAYTVLICFFIYSVLLKYKSYKKFNIRIAVGLTAILIISSVSRSAYIIAFIFVCVLNWEQINRVTRKYKRLFNIIAVFCIVLAGYYIYSNVLTNSVNFMYRIIGIQNYWNYFKEDAHSLIFGVAGIAFRTDDYVINIRSLTGWNGTTESAFLGILIKNGILGMLAYIFVFRGYIKATKSSISKNNVLIFFGFFISAMLSVITEGYLIDVKYVFGPSMFIIMNNLVNGNIE